MKCYFAGSRNPHDFPYVDACFARTQKEAKSLMWRESFTLNDECEGEYINLRVSRHREFDSLFDKSKTAPYLIKGDKNLRNIGWGFEGEQHCDSCGLAAMGIDEFYVCSMCGQCKECGFDGECEDHL